MPGRTLPATVEAALAVAAGKMGQQAAAAHYGVDISTIRRQLHKIGAPDARTKRHKNKS